MQVVLRLGFRDKGLLGLTVQRLVAGWLTGGIFVCWAGLLLGLRFLGVKVYLCV